MKRLILISIILVQILSLPCFAGEDLGSIPVYIKTPEDIAKWFSHDFTYQVSLPNVPQTPRETLLAKGGDCDDLAALASEILNRIGIQNSVAAIVFKDRTGHAICIWKDKDGNYNFISNQKIYYSGEKAMNAAVKKFFPDTEKIVLNFDRKEQGRYFKIS